MPDMTQAVDPAAKERAIEALKLSHDARNPGLSLVTPRPWMVEAVLAFAASECATRDAAPIDMVLPCPRCGVLHVDEAHEGWDNPPHRSHLCGACGCTWRPADVATNGVIGTTTVGKEDNWNTNDTSAEVIVSRDAEIERLRAALQPFAALATELEAVGAWHGCQPSGIIRRASYADCRKARAALSNKDTGQ